MTPIEIDPLAYRKLVGAVLKDFLGRGLDPDDLFQEGMIAVLAAAMKWAQTQPGEPMPGPYATKWVRFTLRNLTRPRTRTVSATDTLDLVADDHAEPDTDALASYFALLTDREADVLALRLGLDGNPGRSAIEAGKALGLWPSRVQVIEKRALARLRKALTDDPRPRL